jgi:hypothetical protein
MKHSAFLMSPVVSLLCVPNYNSRSFLAVLLHALLLSCTSAHPVVVCHVCLGRSLHWQSILGESWSMREHESHAVLK